MARKKRPTPAEKINRVAAAIKREELAARRAAAAEEQALPVRCPLTLDMFEEKK